VIGINGAGARLVHPPTSWSSSPTGIWTTRRFALEGRVVLVGVDNGIAGTGPDRAGMLLGSGLASGRELDVLDPRLRARSGTTTTALAR
jgi:hypothetical protein